MKISFHQIEKWFGAMLTHYARKTVGVDDDDARQELLIAVHEHDWPERPTRCRKLGVVLPINPSYVHRLVRSRARDLNRRVSRPFYLKTTEADPVRQESRDPAPIHGVILGEYLDRLRKRLTDRELLIVEEVLEPSPQTVALAVKQHDPSRSASVRITQDVIAQSTGRSPAAVSRAMTSARLALQDVLDD